jgi:cell division septation protein DedD
MTDYEESGYELQLNNKQLVFFFMAAVAIAVVIFLSGVLVGRGGRDAPLTAGAARREPAARLTSDAGPTRAVIHRELDFPKNLDSTVVDRTLEPPAARVAPANPPAPGARAAAEEAPSGRSSDAIPATAPPAVADESAPGYAVQVVALKTRDAADSLVNRLKTKGYRAYIEPSDGAGLYRVRVGRFADRTMADQVALRLRDVEKFQPYVIQ